MSENKNVVNKFNHDVDEIINRETIEDEYIEGIAFSLFCMHYYNYDFMPGNDDYLIDLKIKELKDLWKLGKLKNKLQFFFNLAEKFYEINFNK